MKDELDWSTINKTRNILLTKSDWTQLPDTGLSPNCVKEWREWREDLRKIDSDNYDDRMLALRDLDELKGNPPRLIFGENNQQYYDRNDAVVSKTDLESMVSKVVNKELRFRMREEPCKTDDVDPWETIDHPTEARKYAQKKLKLSYQRRIGAVSPANELTVLYMERLNQAIDYLSDMGTSFPMLETLAVLSDKTVDDIAKTTLRRHSETIKKYVDIEEEYVSALNKTKKCDKISDLKQILEDFDGH